METSTSPQHQYEAFHFVGMPLEFEDLTNYKRFGLHPVTLGDVLPKPLTCVSDVNKEPRYRIMLKLGYGAFATVWLARDLVEKRYVAVKVGRGSDKPLPDREAEILSQIRETGPGKLGYERVIELLDVLTEWIPPVFGDRDPHVGNFGITLPQLEQFEEDDIMEQFAIPEIIPVVPRDPKFPINSIPPYIVPSASIGYFLEEKKAFPAGLLNVKILDFGRAYRMSQAAPNLLGAPPKMIRPPEFVLYELCHGKIDSTWSEAADIWALGCTLYHVKLGAYLISMSGSLKDFLFRAIQFGGPPPEAWPKLWITHDRQLAHEDFLFDRTKVWKVPHNEERLKFLNFIQRMIITNPDGRPSTTALLTDPFMVASAGIE
ncbi:hypothetical protein E4U56_001263 [Claviceps arundinis]|uniref:non-specific serine/threonine protein kinase n=1 Tax=Claviceps arundinis TaxID=1623583 RepID=A0A9P7MRG7_9HYPO|nr:hypothetical protein E4U56_001263 [Claviceps arundinis]